MCMFTMDIIQPQGKEWNVVIYTTWIDLEGTVLWNKSEREKQICMISLIICRLLKKIKTHRKRDQFAITRSGMWEKKEVLEEGDQKVHTSSYEIRMSSVMYNMKTMVIAAVC